MKKQPSGHILNFKVSLFLCLFVTLSLLFLSACANTGGGDGAKQSTQTQAFTGDAEILASWQGDYAVEGLAALPEEAAYPGIGYIADTATLKAVWDSFDTDEPVPAVAFERNLVLFVRNVQYYNIIRIGKVMVKDGVAEVLAMETLSARRIEDKVAIAIAMIPREGITGIQARGGIVKVEGLR